MTSDAPERGRSEPSTARSGATGKVRVLIATTEGPVEVESLAREDLALGRSVVCIGGYSETAKISDGYHAFVAKPIGVIERLYRHGAFRLDLSHDIDAGRSWQLGVLIAHTLEAEGRLAERLSPTAPEPADTVVFATGAVGSRRLEVDAVDHVARKLNRALPRLEEYVAEGVRVVVATPAGSSDQIDVEARGALASRRIELLELSDARPLFAALGAQAPDAGDDAATELDFPPFRGPEAFDRAHRPAFFGRDAARRTQLEMIRGAAATGCAFLMLTGPSGVGKTSLLRAALVDDLIEAIGDAANWRVALAEGSRREPIGGVARAIADACPDLIDAGALELGMLTEPTAIADELCGRLADAGSGARLFIGVDRLERLLGGKSEDVAAVAAFLERMATCAGASTWVAATLRAEAGRALDRAPGLARMAASGRRMRVLNLDRFEMKEAIEQPIRRAGLSARGSHERPGDLVDRLVDSAARGHGGGALLQRMLTDLYDQDRGAKELSAATLERMGGLEGAVGLWAENAVAPFAAEPDFDGAIERLSLALGKIDIERDKAVPRVADADALISRPTDRAILNALVEARLVVLDALGARAIAVAAHPALLTHWRRASAALDRWRETVLLRDELELGARFWRRHNDDESILLGDGDGLANAHTLLMSSHAQLDADGAAYVRESLASAHRREAKARRRGLLAIGAAVGIAALAALGARELTEAWKRGFDDRSADLASYAIELAEEGRPQLAALLAVAAAPDSSERALAAALQDPSADVEMALSAAWRGVVEVARLAPLGPQGPAASVSGVDGDGPMTGPEGGVARFDPSERWLLVADYSGAALYRWPDLGDPIRLRRAGDGAAPIADALFSPDGLTLVTHHTDGRILRWTLSDGLMIGDLTGAATPSGEEASDHAARFVDADLFFTPVDGDLIAVRRDGGLTIWRQATGQIIRPPDGALRPLIGPSALSSDARTLVTLHDGGAMIWALDGQDLRPRPAAPGFDARMAALSPASQSLILLGSAEDGEDGVRIVDAAAVLAGGDRRASEAVSLPGFGEPVDFGFEVDAEGAEAFWALWTDRTEGAVIQRIGRLPGEAWEQRSIASVKAPAQATCRPRFLPTGPIVLAPICLDGILNALELIDESGRLLRRLDASDRPLIGLALSPLGRMVTGRGPDGLLSVFALDGAGVARAADPADADAELGPAVYGRVGSGPLLARALDRAVWGAGLSDRTDAPSDAIESRPLDLWASEISRPGDDGSATGLLAAAPRGDLLASAIADRPIRLWRAQAPEAPLALQAAGAVSDLAFLGAPGGRGLAAITEEAAMFWRIDASVVLDPAAPRPPDWRRDIRATALAHDQTGVVAIGGRDGSVERIALETGGRLWRTQLADAPISALAVLADGRWIAAAAADCGLVVLRASDGLPIAEVDWAPDDGRPCREPIETLIGGPSGRFGAASRSVIGVFEPMRSDGSLWRGSVAETDPGDVADLGFAADGSIRSLRLTARGAELEELWAVNGRAPRFDSRLLGRRGDGDAHLAAELDPLGRRIAALDPNGAAALFEPSGAQIGGLPTLGLGFVAIEFAPTGDWIATLDRAGGVRFWETHSDLEAMAAAVAADLAPCRAAADASTLPPGVLENLGPRPDWGCEVDVSER